MELFLIEKDDLDIQHGYKFLESASIQHQSPNTLCSDTEKHIFYK